MKIPLRPTTCLQLFSETPGRVLVSLTGEHAAALTNLCEEHGIVAARIGTVTETGMIEVAGFFVPVDDLLAALAWVAQV